MLDQTCVSETSKIRTPPQSDFNVHIHNKVLTVFNLPNNIKKNDSLGSVHQEANNV